MTNTQKQKLRIALLILTDPMAVERMSDAEKAATGYDKNIDVPDPGILNQPDKLKAKAAQFIINAFDDFDIRLSIVENKLP